MSTKKQSLIVATLTSSFGIFVSKALGLIYYTPLSSLAGESNMSYYAMTYTYYDLLLKISSAGIPFAIAALVARYYAKEDYKSVLMVKKLGTSLIMGMTFIVALAFLFVSGPLAAQSMGSNASVEDINKLKNLFLILMLALILVPYLSAVRGYYQGLKRLDLYGSSQALEQFARVGSIILLGFLFVRIFKYDSIYAIYMAIAAAGIAALITIIFFKVMTKEDDNRISKLVKEQTTKAVKKSVLLREILALGVPYLVISFLGSLSAIVNTTFFLDTVTKAGMNYENAKLSMGILQANCNKLASIPQVLTLGFSAGLVPYLSETIEKQDFKKLAIQINQILDTVLYLLIPALFVFVFFSKDVYYIMYGASNLDLGSSLFKVSNMVTLTDTVAPILSSIMITLKLRKEATITLILGCLVKLITFFPCVRLLEATGISLSTAISSAFVIFCYLYVLKKVFKVKYRLTLNRLVLIIISSIVMVAPVYMLRSMIDFMYNSRFICILLMGVCGSLMLLIYFLVTYYFSLPQVILGIQNISPKEIISKLRRR